MAQLPPDLEVKDSLIVGAGKGLFVRRDYNNGERIGRYRGTIYSRKKIDFLPASHKPYLMGGLGNEVIDGYALHNHMRWINHSTEPNAYAHLFSDGRVWIIALRKIKAGEEVYIFYGYDPTIRDKSLITSYLNIKV